MDDFFSIYVETPWDKIPNSNLTHVKLLSLKSILKTFPVIEPTFFEDLSSNLTNYKHYSWYKSIRRIIGPKKEDYDIVYWNFIWAIDNERRMYQLLFQKTNSEENAQRILVALAPPELGKLLAQYKREAILSTLSLLNTPGKIKFLTVLTPKGKSIAEEQQVLRMDDPDLDRLQFITMLKNMRNVEGRWFYAPRCPLCNEMMKELKDSTKGFVRLICPHCGYRIE